MQVGRVGSGDGQVGAAEGTGAGQGSREVAVRAGRGEGPRGSGAQGDARSDAPGG
ncbi:hypothetical protein GCM10010394_52280 [Streptomyces crystallinus]|uniref:Uncharacterized protein n=1 Tax=Streptomyces crystallinus TaxID=68191 RepID=A0ABP3RSU7_9ACTN